MKPITRKELLEAVSYISDTLAYRMMDHTTLASLDVNPGDRAVAQALWDCNVVLRPVDEDEEAQLKSLAACETFGDLLTWCNNGDMSGLTRKTTNTGFPEHGEDEYTATSFQLRHNPDHPKTEGLFRFDVGDHVITPCGKGVVTWLDEETGNCLVKEDKP